MSGLGDKAKGKVNEVKGNAKQGVGRETNDPDMVAEGRADEAKGKGQGVVGKVKGAVEDLKDKVKKD
ncbi:MAG: CsbD family protein [Chloroflexota bacterium]|nr:CsbD family protein [Chloroflexota bacterium]